MSLTAESTSRFADANGIRIHYHEAGEGPVLLLIHGGAPGAFGWGNFGQNMATFAQHFRTIIVDLPGYGKSDKPVIAGGRFTYYAEAFFALLDGLGVDKAHVVGMATGAGAAAMMAILRPDRVQRLALVSAYGGVSLFQPAPTEGMKVIQSYYAGEGPSRERMRKYLEMIIFDNARITDAVVEERYLASVDPEFMEAAAKDRAAGPPVIEPLYQEIHRIKARTLIVWGRENRVQGFDNALYMLARIPDAQLNIYGATGLWVPWERAQRFERDVIAFINED